MAGAGAAPATALGGGLLRAAHRGERLGTDGADRGSGGALVDGKVVKKWTFWGFPMWAPQ